MENKNEIFSYHKRLSQAAISFEKLKDEYLDPNDETMSFLKLVANEWQVDYLDLSEKLWEINNLPAKDAQQ